MGITENAAYLKGLADGLKLDESTNEGKLIVKMLDLIEEMAEKISVLESASDELYTYMEGMAEDEALVFAITEIDGEDCLMVEQDEAVVDAVFENYYQLLREAGVDVG